MTAPETPHRAIPRGAWLTGAVALASFLWGLPDEPHFADESAYVSQAYFLDLLATPDDPAWLEYPAFDLPPLPKYFIGATLKLTHRRIPAPSVMRHWYRDTRTRAADPVTMRIARVPSIVLGILGCLALYGLGTAAFGARVGTLAGVLLAVNPLYRLHARRAMSDIPAEAFLLLCLLAGLAVWLRAVTGRPGAKIWTAAIVAGASGGLAVLSKLNGGLGLMVLAAWAPLVAAVPGVTPRRLATYVGALLVAGLASLVVFVGLNPFVYARPATGSSGPLLRLARMGPGERLREIVRHRVNVSRHGQDTFPNDATRTVSEKAAVVAVQGFGRFGPFGPAHGDSTRRFDLKQDWGAIVWWPIVAFGTAVAFARGAASRRAGRPPTAWCILVYAAVAFVAVTLFIPLAWDRYCMSIQPCSMLLGAVGAAALAERVARLLGTRPAAESVS